MLLCGDSLVDMLEVCGFVAESTEIPPSALNGLGLVIYNIFITNGNHTLICNIKFILFFF